MAKEWFVLRVQSNRETDVRDKLEREVKLEDKEDMIPNVLVPTQTVAEIKDGERQQVEKKLFPGYVIIEVETDESGSIPDSTWYLIRETSGVGDFIGAEKPWPLSDEEVAQLVGEAEEEEEKEAASLDIEFDEGDMVEIQEGPFRDMAGQVEEINNATGRIKVVINVFNRPTPVELHYWQVEQA